MAWLSKRWSRLYPETETRSAWRSFGANRNCFIRKGHVCGKLLGASKSCFVACPADDVLEPILELISEKLTKASVEPIIAVRERAYGQDIFCTKICGRIIESRFCTVILDDIADNAGNGALIPNPNVYYEYGLMTALHKHIIPLQKENLELAFNIQSYDTIKYTSRNIGTELDRAIKDAIRITSAEEREQSRAAHLPEKAVLRKLELAGLKRKDDSWFLDEVVDDTDFIGFGQRDFGFYLYLAKIDTHAEIESCLSDLAVVLYRTENKAAELERELSTNEQRVQELVDKRQAEERSSKGRPLLYFTEERELRDLQGRVTKVREWLSLMGTFYVGFILQPTVDPRPLVSSAEDLLRQHPRFSLAVSSEGRIAFGEVVVSLGDDAS